MPKAIWNGVVLAESDRCETVEGNFYFPPDSIKSEYFKPTDTHTTCPWKGVADYFTLEVNGQTLADAAWTYPEAKERAKHFQGYVAFYKNKGVTIES